MSTIFRRQCVVLASVAVTLLTLVVLAAAGTRPAVKVTIQDEKPVVVEAAAAVDPTPRIRYTAQPFGFQVRDEQNRTLHLSHNTTVKFDDQVSQLAARGGAKIMNQPLPKSASGKARQGFLSVYMYGDLRVTRVMELAATKPPSRNQKREMGTLMVRYTVENTGKVAHRFGIREFWDTYVIDNDGCLFAAPTVPNKVLDGIELKDKTLPEYVQLLQRPDLKNPGYVAHLTLDLGNSIEKANRVILTSLGAQAPNGWDVQVFQAGGDSAMAVFFDPKEIKPGAKREFGFAYGKGIAEPPEPEGRVEVQLGGSFEPGKLFTVTALVHDPVIGQALTLQLPKGMSLVEGREIQPVPQPIAEAPQSLVVWRCRVDELGRFPVQLRSSTGVTQTKIVTISAGE